MPDRLLSSLPGQLSWLKGHKSRDKALFSCFLRQMTQGEGLSVLSAVQSSWNGRQLAGRCRSQEPDTRVIQALCRGTAVN